ncbi:polysaccharide biosynthesis/export family protein [Ochrobactrum sp. A-1]|uniref:polysaccharide biosynthesis/export family protein n=1 Tax=Ochrobactrum sp. A-1 TaxID=2920940 RepID=UPI001F0A62DF
MFRQRLSKPLIAILMSVGMVGLQACASTELSAPTADQTGMQTALTGIVPGATDGELRVVAELPSPPATQAGVAQPVSVSDILDVTIFQVPDLSRTVQVDEGGYISLPLIGQIHAAGKSVQVLQRDIEKAYGSNYLQSPSASVLVKESSARRVTVDGEVRRAGIFPLPHSSSLLDAVALAGGFSQVADPSKVFVFRQLGNTKYVANYSVDDIRRGKRKNPAVHGGDVVVVFPSQSRVALQNLKEVLGVATSGARLATLP